MVGVYRCVRGHTWSPTDGSAAAGPCPVCGSTEDAATPPASDTPRPFVVAEASNPPDADQLTSPLVASAAVEAGVPSIATLATAPAASAAPADAPPPDLHAVTRDFAITHDHLTGAATPTIEAPQPEVPGYDILQEVGRGGMGVVYKARQKSLNRPVALKMILSGSHAGPSERDRFRREAEAVAALQNPHIVQIFEIGEANGHPYLALEFVDGGSLAQRLTGAPWPARDAAALVELLARAMHYAHTQGVVHRDLKPGNVLLNAERGTRNAEPKPGNRTTTPALHSGIQPKITDFGLAKRIDSAITDGMTRSGAVMGTPSYIAPEQASGKVRDVGPAADVYALGAILYELLTGRPPFRGESPLDTVLQVIHDDPVPPKRLQPGVPRDLETICLTCLSKNPAKRYTSALAMAEDLRRFLDGEPILARPLSAWGRSLKWARRHPALAVLIMVTMLATVGLLTVLSVAYARVADAVAQKEKEAEDARRARANEAEERKRAEKLADDYLKAKNESDALAKKILQAKNESDAQAERTKRAAYALQLAQVAAMCERDPKRAQQLLDDVTRCPPELRDFTWAYLRRMCRREERVYTQHRRADALYAVAVAPNGGLVATAGSDGVIRVWDPRTGRTWAELRGSREQLGHADRVLGLAFSPDSSVLASVGADRTLRLWEIPPHVLEAARVLVNSSAFLDRVIPHANLAPEVIVPSAHAGEVTCVAFAPDSRSVITGGADGAIRVWDLGGWRVATADLAATGGPGAIGSMLTRARQSPTRGQIWPTQQYQAHTGAVLCISFGGGGRMFATGGQDGAARVWALEGSRKIGEVTNHADAVRAVALTPDGSLLATANNGSTPTIRLIRTDTWTDSRRLVGHTAAIHALAISADGQLLASGGSDRTVRVWDLEEGEERGQLQGHEQQVSGLAFGPDRRMVVSASTDATARVWLSTIRTHDTADLNPPADLLTAAATTNGSPLVIACEDGSLRVVLADLMPVGRSGAMATGGTIPFKPVALGLPKKGSAPLTVAATPDGRMVLAAMNDGIYLWRVILQRPRSGLGEVSGASVVPPRFVPTPRPVYAMAVSPDGRTLVTLDEEGVRLWELSEFALGAREAPLRLKSHPLAAVGVRDVAFLPEDRLAVAVGLDLWVLDSNGGVLSQVQVAHRGRIEATAFCPANHLLATADAQGVIRVWKVGPGGELVPLAEMTGHAEAVHALSFSSDGRTLASGGADRTVILWDPETGQERAALTGHNDRVIRVQFTADGAALLTIDRGGALRRWRAESQFVARQYAVPPPPPTPYLEFPSPPKAPPFLQRK